MKLKTHACSLVQLTKLVQLCISKHAVSVEKTDSICITQSVLTLSAIIK